MLIGRNLQKKKSEEVNTSLTFIQRPGNKENNITVKWSIASLCLHIKNFYIVEKIVFQQNREEISVLLN